MQSERSDDALVADLIMMVDKYAKCEGEWDYEKRAEVHRRLAKKGAEIARLNRKCDAMAAIIAAAQQLLKGKNVELAIAVLNVEGVLCAE